MVRTGLALDSVSVPSGNLAELMAESFSGMKLGPPA